MTDFELTAINALNEIFPAATKNLCLFHLGQSIYRKIQTLAQLRQHYAIEDLRIQIKTLQACAFVPEAYLYPFFAIAVASLLERLPACRDEIYGLSVI